MSLKKVHDDQPNEFRFSAENIKKIEEILKRYPEKNKKSAVMPLLYLAQKQNENWIPLAAIKYIAKYLSMPIYQFMKLQRFIRCIILHQLVRISFKYALLHHVYYVEPIK